MNKNQEKLHIRDICQDDFAAAYQLIKEIYASTEMMCQPFSEKYADTDSFESEVAGYQASEGAIFLVAENTEGLVGYVTVKPVSAQKLAHTAYLNMGVSEAARAQSVGRELLSAALERTERGGVVEILYLNVRADNVPAVKLYESARFETIAVLTRDTKIGEKYYDGLLMRRFIL